MTALGVTALGVGVAVVLLVGALAVVGRAGSGAAGAGSPPVTSAAKGAAIAAMLAVRAAAERDGDAAAMGRLISPGADALAAAERGAVTDLRLLPFSTWSYRLGPLSGTGGRLSATVTLSYAFAGFDPEPLAATETDTFVQVRGRWLLEAVRDRTPEIWSYGPLTVTRSARALVIATVGGAAAGASLRASLAAEVDRDVPAVTAAWGTDWPQRAVVVVPATTAEVGALAGEAGDLSQVAAVESTETGLPGSHVTETGLPGSHVTETGLPGSRITVNPSAWAELSAVGRRVTMTHELTHVASRTSTTASSPTWLVEGFADAVGFAGSGLAPAAIDAELATDVRAGRVPTALPTDADFTAGARDLAATYEQGWLACRLIESRIGVAGLVSFYRQVGDSGLAPAAAVDAALGTTLRLDTTRFTALWLAEVRAAG